MAAPKNFNLKDFALIVGTDRIEGFADGDAIKIEPLGPTQTLEIGVDGAALRARSFKGDYYKVTVTLQFGSPAISFLDALLILDKLSGQGVVPMALVGVNGGTVFGAASAWVEQEPSVTLGEKPSASEWVFGTTDAVLGHLPLDTAGAL